MIVSSEEALQSWSKFLNPSSLKANLIQASLYLAAWETFEKGVVSHLEGFYMTGFDEHGYTYSDDYRKDVLVRDKSVFRASLLWFKESGVVDDAAIALADRARQHRNEIAHELPAFVAKISRSVDVELLGKLCELLAKIDRWWIRNVEMAVNSDFDGQDPEEIPDEKIQSGNTIFLGLLFDIATGDESASAKFYEHFLKEARKQAKQRPAR